ncbi:MAG: helix-turn-helix domain-containing protein [Mycobacteriales bacterium]
MTTPTLGADPRSIATREQFALQLTLVRERAGLTVRDVAKVVGVPDSTVGGYFSGRHLPPIKPPTLLQEILGACGVTDAATVQEWSAALSRVRRVPGRRPATAPVPYRGLESFQPEHAEWFHGRDQLTDALVGRLQAFCARGTGALVPLVGPSGSGKSSLLRAGLVAAVRAGALAPDSDEWPLQLFSPAAVPPQRLAEMLAEPADLPPGHRLVLVVDQAEEVFTCYDPDRGREYVALLAAAADAGALVVLGLRADFYPHALGHPRLAAALQEDQLVVGPMTEAELRRAIVEPARAAHVEVEDGLVELLLRDMRPPAAAGGTGAGHDPGALPLLSHTLLTLWTHGQRRRLAVADYERAGGIDGAVAASAEAAYDGLDPRQRLLARGLFGRLVHLRDDAATTRRRVPRAELSLEDDDGVPTDLGVVLDRFVEHRLVTVDADSVEVSHEALLTAWPRLRSWIDSDRAGLRIHRQLTDAAGAWAESGRDDAALYRGSRLVVAREWAADPGRRADLNPAEELFLDASTEHERQQQLAVRRRTRRLYRLLATVTVLLVLAGVLAAYAFQQRSTVAHERDLALSRQVARAADQLRSKDPALAMQLSLVAHRVAPTVEARSSLIASSASAAAGRILSPAQILQAVAFSPRGETMAAAGAAGVVRLWDVSRPGSPRLLTALPGHEGTVFAAAFSPDGRMLTTGGADRTVRLWDVRDPSRAQLRSVSLSGGPDGTIYSLTFGPDGTLLAAGGSDGSVRLWRTGSGRGPAALGPPLGTGGGYVQSVSFSPDGRLLAAASADGAVRLWRMRGSRPTPVRGSLRVGGRKVFSVTFGPDGRTVAAAGADKIVRLWDVGDPDRPVRRGTLSGPDTWVNSLAYSSDGAVIAGASSDGKTWLWDVATGQSIGTLPHPAPVTAVSFVPRSSLLATAAADGTVRFWDLPGPVLAGHDSVFTTTFARGGAVLAVGSADDTVRLWDVRDPLRPRRLGPGVVERAPHARFTGASAISRDGRLLAVGGADGTVWLWDVGDPDRPHRLGAPLTGLTETVQSVAFDPGGHLLAASSDDHTVRLWELADPGRPRPAGPALRADNYVYSVVFRADGRLLAAASADGAVRLWDLSVPGRPRLAAGPLRTTAGYLFAAALSPDGRTLAAGGADNVVRLWDVSDPARPTSLGAPLTGPSNYVLSLEFAPDGRKLAAGSGDGSVWLWDLSDRAAPSLTATLTASGAAVFTVAFRPGGGTLVTGGADRTVRLWSIDPDQLASRACSIVGDPITPAEWSRYVPGLAYAPPCPSR